MLYLSCFYRILFSFTVIVALGSQGVQQKI